MLPLGVRLFVSFQAIILLTGLIGLLAVHQFSVLTTTTTELATKDLPEVVTLARLRTLVFQLRDVERRITAGGPNEEGNIALLATTLDTIAVQRATLLAFEPPDPTPTGANDTSLVQTLADELARSSALAEQIRALVQSGRTAEAQALAQSQQEPLLAHTLDLTTTLRAKELTEAAIAATQAQQASTMAARSVLILTVFAVLLSIALAVLMTRSLTRPLATLLEATDAMASGDLDASPHGASGAEFGKLASAFETMRQNLRSTILTLAQERRQTQTIIDATGDGIVVVDTERRIVQLNPAGERLSGWSACEAQDRPCWEVFGCRGATAAEAEEHERACPLKMAVQSNHDEMLAELHARLRSGQRRWFTINCTPIHLSNTDEMRIVMGVHDISQLKAVDQVKSDFVAMVSHELRAPLTTVSSSVEMLGLLDPAQDREAYYEVVNILQQQTSRLSRVIEEVLQLTRFDAGHLPVHVQSLPVGQFLEGLLDQVRLESVADDHSLSYDASDPGLLVWADPSLLEIVLRNLLDNARKYSPPGTPIEVHVGVIAETSQIEIRVIDRGPGIPPDEFDTIFERFVRGASPATRETGGYGLGLYLARELVRAQNGTVWAEPRDEGACIVVSLYAVVDEPHTAAS